MSYNAYIPTSIKPSWPVGRGKIAAWLLPGGEDIDIPVSSSNVLVVGTPGYGKTVFTKAYVRPLLQEDEQVSAVFFQIKPRDFTDEFLRPQDKIITFSEHICPEENLFRWNMVKEIRSLPEHEWVGELDTLTSILFADILQDPRNRIWADGARNVFKGFLSVLLYCYGNNPSNRSVVYTMKTMSHQTLLKFLSEYPPNRSMLRDNFDYDPERCENYTMPRKGSDILFFLQNILSKFEGSFYSEGEDTIYDFLNHPGRRLFILHDQKRSASSSLFETYFMKTLIDNWTSLSMALPGKKLMVLDEIDKIGHDFGLLTGVNLGREFGLQILVSTQSMESLFAIAPDLQSEHLTKAALSGFATTVTFHPGDPYTIETLQMLYGQERRQILAMPMSRYDKPVVSTEMRPIVEDADFAGLDIGECYIKIRNARPVKVKIIQEV